MAEKKPAEAAEAVVDENVEQAEPAEESQPVEQAEPAEESQPVEPTADGINTTLNEDGDIVPLERHERVYDQATGAFE